MSNNNKLIQLIMKLPNVIVSASSSNVLFESVKCSVKVETTETKGNIQVKKMKQKSAEMVKKNGIITKTEIEDERTTITLLNK